MHDMLISGMSESTTTLILLEAKMILESLLGFGRVKVNRSCNKDAHEIAKFGRREWREGVLLELVPPRVDATSLN